MTLFLHLVKLSYNDTVLREHLLREHLLREHLLREHLLREHLVREWHDNTTLN